jgi:hypothetical protein
MKKPALHLTNKRYQSEYCAFTVALEPFDIYVNGNKISKHELFDTFYNSDPKSIEALKSGSMAGIEYRPRIQYIPFAQTEREKAGKVIALRAEKEVKKLRKEKFTKEDVQNLLIKFGTTVYHEQDKIEKEISLRYRKK